MWIECNGIVTCKSGRFEGQFCSDLSDRVLVGAGRLGRILDLKDASLPDHAHRHSHGGRQNFTLRYRTGPVDPGAFEKSSYDGWGTSASPHFHNITEETNFTVDFGRMASSEAFISHITNPKVSKSTAENELYPPHMRVKFMFKCF